MHSTAAFARLAGVTVKALRHYERLGLLVPTRTDARYRRYSMTDLRRLEHILALKGLGLPLSSIEDQLRRPSTSLRAHREKLEQRRDRLDRAIEAIRSIEQHPEPSEGLRAFIREATWNRWEAERHKRAADSPR